MILLALSLLLSPDAFARDYYGKIARSVKPDKKPFFVALEKYEYSYQEGPIQTGFAYSMATSVLCRIPSAYAEQACQDFQNEAWSQAEHGWWSLRLPEKDFATNWSMFLGNDANYRVLLNALAGALEGARPTLTPVEAAEAAAVLANIGGALAATEIGERELAPVISDLAGRPALWAELGAFSDFLGAARAWLAGAIHPAPAPLAAHTDTVCALRHGTIECYGSNRYGILNVPAFQGVPRSVAVGQNFACAVDDNVRCWGEGAPTFPALKKPQKVEESLGGIYVTTEHEVVTGKPGVRPIEPHPRNSAFDHCALLDDGLHCESPQLFHLEFLATIALQVSATRVAPGAEYLALSKSGGFGCALRAGVAGCWGVGAPAGIPIANLRSIWLGHSDYCAVSATQGYCSVDHQVFSVEGGREALLNDDDNRFQLRFVADDRGISCAKVTPSGAPETCDPIESRAPTQWLTDDHRFQPVLCSLADGDVHCFEVQENDASLPRRPTVLPKPLLGIRNVTRMALDNGDLCLLHDGMVSCSYAVGMKTRWSYPGNDVYQHLVEWKASDLRNPRDVALGWGFRCVLDDGGVRCRSGLGTLDYLVPPLKNPRVLAAKGPDVCAADDDGVKCWSY